jgi:hypothetical protein
VAAGVRVIAAGAGRGFEGFGASTVGEFLLSQADAVRLPLPDRSVDLVVGSPPYMDARTYGIGAQRDCLEWVAWMLDVTAEAQRVSKGPVIWVAAGVTRDRCYWPGCEGLMWEWWKRGGECQLYRPCVWVKNGISGSGGDDWFRSDTELAMCFKRPGPLPWSDNTACGHSPKWAPGGEMSHRLKDGERRNQWGGTPKTVGQRRANGKRRDHMRPSHRPYTKRRADGEMETQIYEAPAIANPGNVIYARVGGGLIAPTAHAHENEAPYPVAVPERFIRSLCPPGGITLDPFSGSATTVEAALKHGRRAIGLDLRWSQCELGKRRIEHPHAPVARASRPDKPMPLFATEAS